MPPPQSRPENVLKVGSRVNTHHWMVALSNSCHQRAQELIGVGQQQAALALLHEHVSSKRTRNSPIASLEPVMLLFVELCVNLRKGKLAKDGMYQYKNTAQNTNVGTIEVCHPNCFDLIGLKLISLQLVFRKFIELAEQKVTEAQAKADEVQAGLDQSTTAANVEDLEASETPESILLSTVSGEQSRDRTDRAIVTPWLKFLWETYRTVLDIFKNNARLEVMYQTTAHQAFQFCLRYARKTEFRRLCELLRNHLQNAAKFSQQMHAINLSDPETLQRHLDTRFQQLNVAVELELWQEAFRSVEDIHTLLSLSKRPAKNIMMANYFEKLTRIFLVSENYLFHAAAWSRYFNLLRTSAAAVASGQGVKKDNPSVTEADMTKAASFVMLSALAIPVISTSRSRGALVDVDEARKNKNVRLTNLLGMTQAPTRALLFKDALAKGLLKRCRPEIRELYNILEVDFHPLSICKRISPILTQIGSDPELEKYVLPLQQVILTRLFQQLSQVYESVELKFVLDLAQFPDPYQISGSTIEKFIMNGCKKGDLAIRIDHASGILTFDSDVFSSAKALHPGSAAGSAEDASSVQRLQNTPAEIVRSQLTRLAKALYITSQYVDPSFNEERLKAKQLALERAAEGGEEEHLETLARREVIERKKEAASSALAQKEKDIATQKRIRAQEQQAAEAQRLAEEQRERDRRRLEAEKQRVQAEEARKALEELKRGTKGIDLDELDISGLDSAGIRALKIKALEKEKTELGEKLRVTWRRVDHLERALRQEERKHLPEDAAKQRERDLAAYEEYKAQTLREAEEKHRDAVGLKHRLSRLVPAYEGFRDEVRQQRRTEFEHRRKTAEKELERRMEQRKREFHERKVREKREREEAERKRIEEEEQIAREAEEKARADEERRLKMAEERERREAERRYVNNPLVALSEYSRRHLRRLDEQAAKQRQKEEEAERRIQERKQGLSGLGPRGSRDPAPATSPTVEPAERPAGGPPRLTLQGRSGGLSWRERQAAKEAAATSGDAPPAPSASKDRPSAPPAATDGEPPRRGYVPPALRAEGGGWRERENSDRSAGRDESPADAGRSGSGRYQAPARREFGERGERSYSGRGRDTPDGRDSPASGAGTGEWRTGGGYRPPHLRGEGGGGGRPESPAENGDASSVPPARQGATGDGKYRPGAFRERRG